MRLTRLVAVDDAAALAAFVRDNREHLAAWDNERDEDWYTEAGQRTWVEQALADHAAGRAVPMVAVEAGRLVGTVGLQQVFRGGFQSCKVGYQVAAAEQGRGLAGRALAEALGVAFDELGLHRVEAGALVHNARSRRVLERAGFRQFGTAPSYQRVGGTWRDMALYQLLEDDPRPSA